MNGRTILFMACVILGQTAHAEGLAEHQARFAEVTGSVELLTQGSSQWVDAHIDLPLETGDTIRVGEEGQAEISLTQNVLLILDSDSEMVIGHTVMQEGHITLSRGALAGKVEGGMEGVWEFATPLGMCIVRGTEFTLIHSEEKGTHLGVFKGSVQMTPAESATGSYASEFIQAHEEGVLEKRKPLERLKSYSLLMKGHFPAANRLKKRFTEVSDVWVPMTPAYRLELRRKYIPEVKPHKTPPRPKRVPRKASSR